MARLTKRSSALLVVVALTLVAAACSGSGNKTTKPPATSTASTAPTPITSKSQWDASGVQRVLALGREIKAAYKGECADLAFLPRDQYVDQATRLHFVIPLAVADCTAFGDNQEISAFPTDAVRDSWNQNRVSVLCARATAVKFRLQGLHFALVSTATIQGTSEYAAKQLAAAVKGTYEPVACPGVASLDWEPAAEARVKELASLLASRPSLKCDGYELLDRDTYAINQAYVNRLPAAYARCNGPGGAVFWIAAFSARSASRDKFVTGETQQLCGSQAGVTAVLGPDWAVITGDAHLAAVAAAALGGTASAPSC